jgi:hypothetical protein
VIRTLGYFVAGSLCGAALLAAGYAALYGNYGVLCVAVAGLICIIPTLLSLMLALWSRGKSGADQLMSVVGGMGLRMGVALVVGIAVFKAVPLFEETRERSLVYWSAVLIMYIGTLALETFLTARANRTTVAGATPAVTNGAGE